MKPTATSDREHEFSLVLTGIADLEQRVEDALYEAGCDDATLGMRCGTAYLTFSRTAPSYKEAVLSAIRDVRNADIGADVLRVDECFLVSQADIARKLDVSRQLIHQYLNGTRGSGAFPPPACHITDRAPLWYWCDVAHWLSENNMVKPEVFQQAVVASLINSILDLRHQRHLAPGLAEELIATLG